MPRRFRRPDPPAPRPVGPPSATTIQLRADPGRLSGEVEVRPVPAHQARKPYRCPGCDHEIAVGTGHVVVVPKLEPEARRHWHRGCWEREVRRRGSSAGG